MKFSLSLSILLATLHANIVAACPFSNGDDNNLTPPDDANHKNLRLRHRISKHSPPEP